MNETTYNLLNTAEPVLSAVREKLFDAADCERPEHRRVASLESAEHMLRALLKQIEFSRKEIAA